MIRLIQKRLIIPRGDTGTFSIPVLAGKDSNDVSIFTIFDPLTHRKIFEKKVDPVEGMLHITFTHGDTVNLPVGQYVWDIKFYTDPVFAEEQLVDGVEVDSYYALFNLPICEIRETGDSMLYGDDAPAATLAPDQIDLITRSLADIHISMQAAIDSATAAEQYATSASGSATAAESSASSAIDAAASALENKNAAALSAQEAAASVASLLNVLPTKVSDLIDDSGHYIKPAGGIPASDLEETYLTSFTETDPTVPEWAKSAQKPTYTAQEVGALPDSTYIPNKVSDLQNDAGYLTEHQDISGKADSADLATVATSGSYNDLSNKPFIPNAISDLTDDSGHYTKPVTGIPASDLEETYLTSFTETDPTVPSWAKEAEKPTYTATEVGAIATDHPANNITAGNIENWTKQSNLLFVDSAHNTSDYWWTLTIPRNALRNIDNAPGSSGNLKYLYVPSISGSNLVRLELPTTNGKLALITDVPAWARAADKPTYTAQEVGAPTVAEMNSAISTAIGNINSFDMAVVQELPTQDISTHTIYLVPKTGETNDVYDEYIYINNAWEMIGNTQIDLSNYVQKTDYASTSNAGVVKINSNLGITRDSTGTIGIFRAFDSTIKAGTDQFYPIVSSTEHTATFYGLAKAAGDTTQAQSDNAVGTYTDAAKTAIRTMLGVATPADIPTNVSAFTNDAGYLTQHQDISGKANAADLSTVATSGSYEDLSNKPTIPEVPVQDVQFNGTSILDAQGVATIPMATTGNGKWGLVRIGSGLYGDTTNGIMVERALPSQIKAETSQYLPIVPAYQHHAVFYGLAKLAGADMAQSSNEVGIYTDSAKAAIQNMLGITNLLSTEESATATAAHALNSTFMMNGKLYKATAAIAIGEAVVEGQNCEVVKADEVFVKNTDYATNTTSGVVRIQASEGISIYENGIIFVNMANDSELKRGTSYTKPVVPRNQHTAIYYALSKLAGVDLANETVTIGTYPETSKTAIRSLIGAAAASDIPNVPVQDVQVNGTSVLSSGIANIPMATTSISGAIILGPTLEINASGKTIVKVAGSGTVKSGTSAQTMITPMYQHEAAFYGLTKAAGVDMASSSNAVGTYTDAAKVAIRSMIGATSSNVIAIQDEQPTNTDTKIWMPETAPEGVEIPTMADLAGYVQKTDIATSSTCGIVKTNANFGTAMRDSPYQDTLMVAPAGEQNIKEGVQSYQPIVPSRQHISVYYGLSRLAGVNLANETVTVGTYPETSKTAIRNMLGAVGDVQVNGTSVVNNGVATIPLVPNNDSTVYGLVKVSNNLGVIVSTQTGHLTIQAANSDMIKVGTTSLYPLAPNNTDKIVFYGLTKAAGVDMASSSNAVGTYTAEAKAAIHTMLGIDPASIAAQVDIPLVETVSGTTPTITGQPNVRYVCGEVSTITITPPASGSVDVIFESGSTATTMTVPSTVKWPAWFDAETLEVNTTYEILITDGIYGSVMTWAT